MKIEVQKFFLLQTDNIYEVSEITYLMIWRSVFNCSAIRLGKQNTETLLQASRNIGLEINAENIKFMIMSRHQNSG
jgi:hypothetical protein